VPAYVALLRAINLGARNKVSMADLREVFAAVGAEDVTTYVQSGNVVFRSSVRSASRLEDALEQQIGADLGLDLRVLVRTAGEIDALLKRNPFRDPSSVYVTFLAEKPPTARVRELDPERSPPDEFRVVGRDIYLHCPNGYGPSKLSNAYFEKQLGVAATTRNWRTVTKLAELSSDSVG
jgi:uncharacterized protein (DUF1697 family)